MLIESIITFGNKHNGKNWDDPSVPISWLRFIAEKNNNEDINKRAIKELVNRGADPPGVKVSWTAINNASISCMAQFEEREKKYEGLFTWLQKTAYLAMEFGDYMGKNRKHGQDVFHYKGLRYEVTVSDTSKTLISVYPIQTA